MGIDVVSKQAVNIVMTGASTQEFFVRPNSSLRRIGFHIANGFKKRVSGIRDLLCHQDLRTICHWYPPTQSFVSLLLYHVRGPAYPCLSSSNHKGVEATLSPPATQKRCSIVIKALIEGLYHNRT